MNITLIGYRGTGKSTIGQCLATHLRMTFADADALLVARAGKTIRELFDTEGEQGFRDRETAILGELASSHNILIAAGGGAVLRPQNVAALKASGKLVWLQADAETLHARITADAATAATRPNLTTAGGLDEIRALLAVRLPLYEAAADLAVDVSRLSVLEAVERIARDLQPHLARH